MDKQKLIDYLQSVIDSCKVVGNASDKAIIWQCERILKNIELGMFNSDR